MLRDPANLSRSLRQTFKSPDMATHTQSCWPAIVSVVFTLTLFYRHGFYTYLFPPLLFVMYLSPHPDAPTTTPKPTTATTTTTIITTTISYPEVDQGTVSPSRSRFISVCVHVCVCVCTPTMLDPSMYVSIFISLWRLYSCFLFNPWAKVMQPRSFTKLYTLTVQFIHHLTAETNG